jgi:fructose-1,6-bisphosphatase class II
VDRNLALEFVRVTEAGALASAMWVGKGDREGADQAATDAMRKAFDSIDMDGTVVIGEGERDEAPMLYIGEKVGSGNGPNVAIAVDPLEGTNLCANGTPNAISVIGAAREDTGALMHAPDIYMDKLVVGPAARGAIDITLPPRVTLAVLSKCLGKDVDELTVGVLDRDRHRELLAQIRAAGARVMLVSDGDLSLAIAAIDETTGLDVLMGIGGAPEGVITACAVRCMGGDMQARFAFRSEEERERTRKMLDGDPDRVFTTEDLASGDVVFCATGVTSGPLLKGVVFTQFGATTESVVMRSHSGTVRRMQTRHVFEHVPSY